MYTTKQVFNILKITQNQLSYLIDCQLIQPIKVEKYNFYTFNDLIEIKALLKIKKAGFALNRLKNVKEFFTENDLENTFSDKQLIVCEKTLYLSNKDFLGENLIGLIGKNERQVALKIIDLDDLVGDILPYKNINQNLKSA